MEKTKRRIKKRKRWCDADEDFLMELWSYKIEDLRGPRKNSYIYQEMSESLAAVDAFYTPYEIKIKLHNLTNRYRKEKRAPGSSKWRLYEKMHFIFGELRTDNSDILGEDNHDVKLESEDIVGDNQNVKMEYILPSSPSPEYWESSSDSRTSTPPPSHQAYTSTDVKRSSFITELTKTDDMIKSQLQAMQEIDEKLLKLEKERNSILRDFANSCDKFHTNLLNVLKK